MPDARRDAWRFGLLLAERSLRAEEAGELDDVYERLGSQIGTRDEQREITAGFAGGAILLLGGGLVASLRRFGRLP